MIDPRIAQRQIELEQKKKQQQNNIKITPAPAASPAPAAPKPALQPSYSSQKVTITPAVKQTVDKTIGSYSSGTSNAAKGTVASTLAKAQANADSVYKSNSGIGSNEYTTISQRQSQNKARQDYINRMKQSLPKEYNGYTQPQRLGGYSAESKPEKNSTFEKVENQSVNYAKSGWKLFDWMDDFSQNKGPNNEISDTVRMKAKERADLTAGVQGDKPQKPVEMYVSKDIVKEPYDLTERQKLQKEILELYGEKGRKGVQERHSLSPDADVFDTSYEQQKIIALEQALDAVERTEKTGLYNEDMSMLDRFGNTAKEWANKGLYSVDYIAQTAGTALTDYFESQLNEEYNRLINRRQDIVVQLNRITFGLDEDPYGKREKALAEQLENVNRQIEENYRIKMDIATDAYRAMERAQRYEDKAVEGLNSGGEIVYNIVSNIPEMIVYKGTSKINKVIPFIAKMFEGTAEKMHEINSSGGTAGQAFETGAVTAGISLAAEKLPMHYLAELVQSDVGKAVLHEEFARHGMKLSKGVLEYTAKHIADIAAQNSDAEFSMGELVQELIKDYTETAINSF